MAIAREVEARARRSRGTSNDAILQMVSRAIARRQLSGKCLVDVGCGPGNLYQHVRSRFDHYLGVDAVRYEDFPEHAEFCRVDLDSGRVPLPDNSADVVTAVEVIEHLENPREFMRKLVRLAKPGGWVIVTTPNQLSLLSLLTLLIKNRFQAFQDVHYPAHLTALLEIDLRRIAAECDLVEIGIEYSLAGRFPLTARSYPQLLSRRFPRALSENVLMAGKRTAG
jgi:2-polyprenyl-3-methyl-5-hydroxy-6-metoxy-1,4-benzoquinol methylase